MPSSARFLMSSFPIAPAPTTRMQAFLSFSWSHQGISRRRLYRSSAKSAEVSSMVLFSSMAQPAVISG